MLLGWFANAQRCDNRLIIGNLAAALLTALHLLCLGSPLGCTNQLLSAGRFALARHDRSIAAFLLLCGLALLQGILLANHWSEWCAVIAAVLATYSLFFCRGSALRMGLLLSNGLNLTLSLHLESLSGVIYQVITLCLLMRALAPEMPLTKKPA